MKLYSLTRRLVLVVLLIQFISAVSIIGLAVAYERHSHFRSFDIMLRGRADSLLGAVQDAEDTDDNVMLDGTEVSSPASDIYEVVEAKGRLLGRSANWSGPSPSQLNLQAGIFFKLRLDGRHYRAVKIAGLRMVDPGDKGGGIPRHVVVIYGAPTDSVWREIWRTVAFYALTSLALLVLSGAIMFWMMHRGLAPLRELAAEASSVSANSWTFSPSERVRRTTELAPLAGALETVLHGLESSFMQQRQFVGDAAHELKTAVAVVKSSLQLLAMKDRTMHEYKSGLEQTSLDCERMEEIVAKMLTLARVESPVEPETTLYAMDLTETAHIVVRQLNAIAEIREVQVVLSAPVVANVNVEPEQLLLLCSNLVLNAIQHSPQQSHVRIIIREHESAIELCVKDNGTGIEPEALPYVFDRFYRSDPSRSRITGGTGLGLTICKAIVSKFGGEIKITSKVSAGTTVTVQFPKY